MASERWRRIEDLYHRALEQPADSRAAFLAWASAGDEALRREVESLLASSDGADDYLETPAVQVAAQVHAQDEARWNIAGRMVSHYRVAEKLGDDPGVKVYRAEDIRLGRPVTLRFLHRLTGDSEALEHFLREARAASVLNHPNILAIYDIDEFEGVPFVAEEVLEGQTLDRRLAGSALAIDELLDLALEMTDGLDAVHARGLLHRGLNAATLFITTRGQVKILDFGLASPSLAGLVTGLSSQTSEFDRLVTGPEFSYFSPEQLRGEDLDQRTDLFSLGAVLYEMATGKKAFDGSSRTAVSEAVQNRAPIPVLQLNPRMPSKLGDAIGKALEKDREVRYQHVADLRADLKRVKREIDALRNVRAATATNQPARLGRYEITGALGEGGMGTVYQGTDPVIGRTVAIKTILQDRLGSSKEAAQLGQRLMREARAAGGLAHPNIVTVFDAGEEGGVRYIVMELIRGSTLDAMLPAAGTPMPTERALAILGEVAAALDFAHRHNVIHRDVKPSNIMIQADGTVKLADFGIARLTAGTLTMSGTLAGSPAFMSPEQLRGEEATARSDQYSLAVVAWILLTGSKPFDDEQLVALMTKILEQEPPGNSNLSPAADGVLRRALAKDPAARFESCSSLVAALRDACNRTPAPSVIPAPAKRHGVLTAAGVLACVLLVGAIVWLLWPPRAQPGPKEQQAGAISPSPLASGPPVDIQPKAGPPQSQVAASSAPAAGPSGSGAKPAGKVPPAGDSPAAGVAPSAGGLQAPVSPPPGAPDAARSGAVARPQSSSPNRSKINPADGLKYVWIPAGDFWMGCSQDDTECFDNEKPRHYVTISKGFWMGQTEVTQEAYRKIMGQNPSGIKAANHPVGGVSWDEAQGYCQAVGMRLPTEAEWEYAARAGSKESRYGDPDQISWIEGNSENRSHDVAGKEANAWGLYDMLGNVSEWVADWLAPYPPGNAIDPQGAASGKLRVFRGGAFLNPARFSRVSRRIGTKPPAERAVAVGLRCAGN